MGSAGGGEAGQFCHCSADDAARDSNLVRNVMIMSSLCNDELLAGQTVTMAVTVTKSGVPFQSEMLLDSWTSITYR